MREKATAAFDNLMFADWVDTDEHLELLATKADGIISSYRSVYASNPDEETSKAMERLHVAKEAARLSEAYADHIEVLIRHHEDMVGSLGNDTAMESGQEKGAVNVLKEYVEIVNKIEDREIRRKIEMELGRKMVLMRQVLSIANFSKDVAPIAGDRIVTKLRK